MALGIENSGIEAGIIERGGAALSATIQQAGQKIQQSLLQQQAFRQARELGTALSQTDPASDKWPQQAAFLSSQYPLAAASGLTKEIITPMAKAYAGFQAAKKVDDQFGNSVALENLRSHHAMERAQVRPSAGGLPINFEGDPLEGDVTPGQQNGIQGVLRDTFSTMRGDQPQGEASVLPGMGEIPDGAKGMSERSRREMVVLRDLSNENAASQRKGGPVLWNTKNQPTEINRRLKEEEKMNAPAADFHESEMVPGVMMTKTGTPFIKTDAGGIARPGGQFEAQRLKQTKEAQEARMERAKQTDVVKKLDREMRTVETDLAEARRALKKYRDDQIKSTDDENLKQRVFVQEKAVTDLIAKRNAKLGEYTDTLKTAVEDATDEGKDHPSTRIIERNGKKYEVDDASKKVIREVQ